jgi:superfamily II DNA or RNA helicase
MPFSLTIQEIRKRCGHSYYQRGLNYQRQGRVLDVEWNEATRILNGEVAGSGEQIYRQEISFSLAPRERFHGYCSCPVAEDCKHVVAVLLEWIEQNLEVFDRRCNPDSSLLERWQQEIRSKLQSTDNNLYPALGDPCLLYLLHSQGEGREQILSLQTLKSRRLKRGGWGKTNKYYSYEQSGYYGPPAGLLPIDREIAQLLPPHDSFSHTRTQLEGDIGLLVLQRLLRSGRCFFQSTETPPLSGGPARKANFEWQEEEQGTSLKIELEGSDSDWLLIPTSPPWYLDTDSFQCGPIEQPLTTDLFQSLGKLPPVVEEQLTDLSRFLLQQLPANSIPLPVELNIKLWDQPPLPILHLHSVAGPSGRRQHLARLRFQYGPLTLTPELIADQESCLVRHHDEDWQIKRYPQIEASCLELLRASNFIAAPPPLGDPAELDLYFSSHKLEDSALAWMQFLAQLPQFETDGWQIEIDPSFQLSFETANNLQAEIDDSQHNWFEVGLNIEHDGHKISLLPLLTQWLENRDPQQPLLHQLEGSRWLEVPASILEPIVGTLVELFQDPQLSDAGQLKLPRPQAHGLLEMESLLSAGGHKFVWQGGKKLRQLAEKLKNFQGIETAPVPTGLNAELRNYQQQGLSWLQFLREYGFNGVLADDMGLGKTIQALAHLLLEKEVGRLDHPALIVAPTSVLSNWQREAARFTPELKCLILHGPARSGHFEGLERYDLVITSYALLTRDLEQHLKHSYHSLILDEAQAIKNPRAKSALAACSIKAAHRLCLTGTPLENHLGELWSLFQFLMPGFLSTQKRFTSLFRTPIEKHHDHDRQQQLQQRMAPFILRRDKAQVVRELPPKTLMVREVELNAGQSKLYESLRLAMTDKIGKLLQKKGLKNSQIEILDALLKLRQVCCDPRLVKLESARKVKHSAKLEMLLGMLEELLEEGRKILIFSQFTSMISLIEAELLTRDIDYTKLTGQTRKRDAAIAAFQEGAADVFLISLKAGGVGLNLTAADTVIHYDPWWNPAVENQATDRAHRIGQQKPVFVYKLVAKGTLEEKILQLQEKKQLLADGVYQKSDKPEQLPGMSSEDILSLLTAIE